MNVKVLVSTFFISSVLILFLVSCSSEATFNNSEEVVKTLDKHSMTDCDEKFGLTIGAREGISCQLSINEKITDIEIYTYSGDAKEACQLNEYCKSAKEAGEDFIFYGNLLIWLEDNTVVSKKSILDDLKD